MVCDNLDGKEEKRRLLFSKWYLRYNNEGTIVKFDASAVTEDYQLYVSIYMNKDNQHKDALIAAFYDLVKNNLYPME